ncbi:MAG TPA: 30S ribosomal protein S7 [Spirochaetes bacterium]|nr:30S ribosomal protein S7 [Spirochaetota bacterium]
MPRRHYPKRKTQLPDPKFKSNLAAKFINNLMKEGKKNTAQRILYGAFQIIEDKLKKPPLDVFNKAIENVKPDLEVKSRRVGGATYQVPIEVRGERKVALAIRWIIGFAKSRQGKSMSEKLADELIDTYNKTGTSIKKKEDTRKMAEANKAFAHYKW